MLLYPAHPVLPATGLDDEKQALAVSDATGTGASLHTRCGRLSREPSRLLRQDRLCQLQDEGEIIHVICDRIIDHNAMLRLIAHVKFAVVPGCGDGASNGGNAGSARPDSLHGGSRPTVNNQLCSG